MIWCYNSVELFIWVKVWVIFLNELMCLVWVNLYNIFIFVEEYGYVVIIKIIGCGYGGFIMFVLM